MPRGESNNQTAKQRLQADEWLHRTPHYDSGMNFNTHTRACNDQTARDLLQADDCIRNTQMAAMVRGYDF